MITLWTPSLHALLTHTFLRRSNPPAMPPVWFTLVDSEGHPYNQSKVGKVQITDAEADITDLLAAVWSQCKDIFTGSRISVINLEVYPNRQAFDKKEGHLDEEHRIHGLGSSKQEAVVILVPSLESLYARGLIPSCLFLCCCTLLSCTA